MTTKDQYVVEVARLLERGPMDSAALIRALGVSQPTFSRIWRFVPKGVTMGAARARKYALTRDVPGVDAPIPLSRITEDGNVVSIGDLHVLMGGWYALTKPESHEFELFFGLPYFLRDLRPQGFLGRAEPGRNPDLELPRDILQWSDDHVLKYLSRRSEHAAGNIILGNESHLRYLTLRADGHSVTVDQRAVAYPVFAQAAMQGEAPGSSAGGEQPKFTCEVRSFASLRGASHVIVKFSPPTESPSGRRWGDLLICEHLALDVLSRKGIPAANSTILESEGRIFLQVERFDRLGHAGRAPMVTLSALDGDLGMLDKSWSVAASALATLGKLNASDVAKVEILDLYGALIGNVDKHHGNIAFAWDFDGTLSLLPAYDMLPMLYRPSGHGEVVAREWSPTSIQRMQLRHLDVCFELADEFWNRVIASALISDDFKQIAVQHRNALEPFNPRPQMEIEIDQGPMP
jgi:hypothetical protein